MITSHTYPYQDRNAIFSGDPDEIRALFRRLAGDSVIDARVVLCEDHSAIMVTRNGERIALHEGARPSISVDAS